MRKMASIRVINDIRLIPGADAIECAVVGGWNVVVKKGEFTVGDLTIFCEIDGWIPHELAPFLSKGQAPREYNGVQGERLRTVKLRGQVSQGLLIAGTICPSGLMVHRADSTAHIFQEGDDVSEWLGIVKYEPPLPAQLAGEARGLFPSFIPKTDQERIQNLTNEFADWTDLTWEVTEKLDGSSMTVYVNGDDFGVCSRNLNLRDTADNTMWQVAHREGILTAIQDSGLNIAVQGEIIGTGIQGNPYKIAGQSFYVFDIFDIDKQSYFTPQQRQDFCQRFELLHVPVLDTDATLPGSVADVLLGAEAKSELNGTTEREGLVYKCNQQPLSFKAISNRFLLKSQ
jgi:RNA ligase (TIGR02306 family)